MQYEYFLRNRALGSSQSVLPPSSLECSMSFPLVKQPSLDDSRMNRVEPVGLSAYELAQSYAKSSIHTNSNHHL